MKFSAEWLDRGDDSTPELLATSCQLAIDVGGVRVSQYADHRRDVIAERIVMPAYPLAEGLVRNWWSLMAGRTGEFHLKVYRDGFAVPDLRFAPDGRSVDVSVRPVKYSNPPINFFEQSKEYLPLPSFERDIRQFVENVLDRLHERAVEHTVLEERWAWILRSLQDAEELAFCEAAGALGVDPYQCTDSEANSIDNAARWFAGELLGEFLAGEHGHTTQVLDDIQWIEAQEQFVGSRAELADLVDWSAHIWKEVPDRADNAPWQTGYRAAHEIRALLGLDVNRVFESTASLAGLCGAKDFLMASQRSRGLKACISFEGRSPRVLVNKFGRETSALFALARSIGDFVVYAQTGRSPITATYSHRQAVGRAFAAELLAPAEVITEMAADGFSVEEIAEDRHVSTMVIQNQLANHPGQLVA